jgi:hypothetical protein
MSIRVRNVGQVVKLCLVGSIIPAQQGHGFWLQMVDYNNMRVTNLLHCLFIVIVALDQ